MKPTKSTSTKASGVALGSQTGVRGISKPVLEGKGAVLQVVKRGGMHGETAFLQ